MAVNCGLAGAEERWGITFLSLLATVLLMQHTTLLAFFATRALCWLMANLKSTRIPRAFPEKLFFGMDTWELFLSQSRFLHLLLLDFIRFLSAYFYTVYRSQIFSSSPVLQRVGRPTHPTQIFGVVCKLVDCAVCPAIWSIIWFYYSPLQRSLFPYKLAGVSRCWKLMLHFFFL